jgi:hypothetical protein
MTPIHKKYVNSTSSTIKKAENLLAGLPIKAFQRYLCYGVGIFLPILRNNDSRGSRFGDDLPTPCVHTCVKIVANCITVEKF